jgi:tetratricopeptide (TPR) repeat protein
MLAVHTMPQLTIQEAFESGVQHHQAGRLQEAEQLYRQILARQPDHAGALHYLGLIAQRAGRGDIAVDLIRRAIVLWPNYAEAHSNLGNILMDNGRLDEAVAAYHKAIALSPRFPKAFYNLGNALVSRGQLDEAIAAYRQAIALRLNHAVAHSNLGNALKDRGQLHEAIASYRLAIAMQPDYPEAHSNLGNALQNNGQLDEAIAAHRRAVALNPELSGAHSNLGSALKDAGQLEAAIAAYRQAIILKSDFAEAHFNLALSLLLQGDFRSGWAEHEWRWKCKGVQSTFSHFSQPQWDGSDLTNRTILLHVEQGLGDAIQFVRYLPLVAERGAKVIFRCNPELRRLLEGNGGVATWLAPGEPAPPFDLHCPLLSLSRAFGTTLESIPARIPYVFADPKLSEFRRTELAAHSPALKAALVWAGSPTHKNDRNRSMKLADLVPLMHLPGVRCFSLQKGEAAAQATTLPEGIELIDWTSELTDFADTAALIANLDVVISVDTAVAHLAGAMGKPVWLMLPFAADWRWLTNRNDSPWYPTMRLFRQPAWGDWKSVVAEIARALSLWSKNRSHNGSSSRA